jgi:DNA replication and repair protein RecF
VVLVTGPNGAGKTNLLESLHVGTQGFSPRSRMDSQLVRAGASHARVALAGDRAGVVTAVEVTLGVREGKRIRLNGAPLRSAEALRGELTTLVFTPDRLSVVKGAPAVRRAYFDRVLTRLLPARADLPVDYGTALGQRNAVLRRVGAGLASIDAVEPWTAQVARLGHDLAGARSETIELLREPFAERANELGLADTVLAYDPPPLSEELLRERLPRDVERGTTGIGPHLDDIMLRSGSRDLRSFGSQGEQRVAVLSLLLAESELLQLRRTVAPLVLLDDVLSELDGTRRAALAARLAELAQVVVTATGPEFLPLEPVQRLQVTPGKVTPV